MLKNTFIKPIIPLFLFILIFACSKDEDPEPANEEEVITLVTLEVTKVGSSETITYNFEVEGHAMSVRTMMTIMMAMKESI